MADAHVAYWHSVICSNCDVCGKVLDLQKTFWCASFDLEHKESDAVVYSDTIFESFNHPVIITSIAFSFLFNLILLVFFKNLISEQSNLLFCSSQLSDYNFELNS